MCAYTDLHRQRSHSPEKEKRLCRLAFDSPGNAHEALTAGEEIKKNPVMKNAVDIFNQRDIIRKFPEMRTPIVREHFFALVFANAVRGDQRPDYQNVRRPEDVNIADPYPLLNLPQFMPPAGNLALGRWLKENFDLQKKEPMEFADLASRLGVANVWPRLTSASSADRESLLTEVGQQYRQKLQQSQNNWLASGTKPDDLVVESTINHYLAKRKVLDDLLARHGVEIELVSKESTLGQKLSQDEYLTLLSQLWRNEAPASIEAIIQGKLPAIRAHIEGRKDQPASKKLMAASTDVSVSRLGPQETLNRFGVVIGTIVPRDYSLYRAGKLPGQNGALGESASTWIDHPERAYGFLNDRLVSTAANDAFMKSLYFHLVLKTDADKENEKRASGDPKLDEKDTKAILALIIQTLVRREQVFQSANREREEFRKKEGFDEKVERHAGDMWEYLKDVRSHPVGSILMGLAAFVMVRKLWSIVRPGKDADSGVRNIWRYMFYAGLGGAAIALYQKHSTGSSPILDSVGKMVSGVRNSNVPGTRWLKEEGKNPEEQTLPQYWKAQLDNVKTGIRGDEVKSQELTYCLSILHAQRVDTVLEWYGKADRQMNESGGRTIEPLPFAIPNRDRFFGNNRASGEVAQLFYHSLSRFFAHRGIELQRDPVFSTALRAKGDTERGYSYMRLKYLDPQRLTVLLEDRNKLETIEIDGRTYDLRGINIVPTDFSAPTNPTLIEIRELCRTSGKPDLYEKILTGTLVFRQMGKVDNRHQWSMSEVFLLEADPTVLSAMGPNGARAGDFLAELQSLQSNILPPGGMVAPGVVLSPGLTPHAGVVLTPGTFLPAGVVLPPQFVPPGVVLNPAIVAPGVVLPTGFIPPPGLVLPAGTMLGPGVVIPPAGVYPPAVLNGVVLPPTAIASPGTILGPGCFFPAGTLFPPSTVPSGIALPPPVIAPGVLIPAGVVVPPGTVLPAGTIIKPGTYIRPAYVK